MVCGLRDTAPTSHVRSTPERQSVRRDVALLALGAAIYFGVRVVIEGTPEHHVRDKTEAEALPAGSYFGSTGKVAQSFRALAQISRATSGTFR